MVILCFIVSCLRAVKRKILIWTRTLIIIVGASKEAEYESVEYENGMCSADFRFLFISLLDREVSRSF